MFPFRGYCIWMLFVMEEKEDILALYNTKFLLSCKAAKCCWQISHHNLLWIPFPFLWLCAKRSAIFHHKALHFLIFDGDKLTIHSKSTLRVSFPFLQVWKSLGPNKETKAIYTSSLDMWKLWLYLYLCHVIGVGICLNSKTSLAFHHTQLNKRCKVAWYCDVVLKVSVTQFEFEHSVLISVTTARRILHCSKYLLPSHGNVLFFPIKTHFIFSYNISSVG